MLGFFDFVIYVVVVDEFGNFVDFSMIVEFWGMFFVVEDVFGGDSFDRLFELMCYCWNFW